MQLEQIATITYREPDSNETCVVVVRMSGRKVGLTLSREADGDVEVFMSLSEAQRVRAALDEAITRASR